MTEMMLEFYAVKYELPLDRVEKIYQVSHDENEFFDLLEEDSIR